MNNWKKDLRKLKNDKFTQKNKKKRVVVYFPVEPFRPTLKENKMFADYCRLLGYHFKLSVDKKCPIIFSPDYKRHVYIQKEDNRFSAIFGNARESVDDINNLSLGILKNITKQIEKRSINFGITKIREVYGIQMLNI